MDFEQYSKKAHSTAIYPKIIVLRKDGTKKDISWVYPILGLVGEIGEIANKLKKVIRDNNFVLTNQMKEDLEEELGDAFWYFAETIFALKMNSHKIMKNNNKKLASRKKRGKIIGKGDKR